ncbi:phage holin family protein [Pseudorhodobacter sp.]|uniref:phage holin family protein n=1 Tax=Pseudorhodobacter sp. TaxID=1934400 RepID=UPI0026497CED|nr:phage holin family protein [Pseudorhodobacter sp.]MDN5787509.1 phage holin family protein [Pseudorhodobacter sp.]
MTTPPNNASDKPGLSDDISNALSLIAAVFNGHVALVRAEIAANLRRAIRGLLMLVIAALLGLTALNLLAATLVLVLIAFGCPPALAALGIATLAIVAALILLAIAAKALKPSQLIPTRTVEHLSHGAGLFKEKTENDP